MPIAEIRGARRKEPRKRPVGDALDGPVIGRSNDHGDEDDQNQSQNDGEKAAATGDSQGHDGNERHKTAHHEHVAMGEVDHADNAVNHRVADGDKTVD